MDLPRLLIATNNKGKLKEIRALLNELRIQLVMPSDINLNLEVVEDGYSYVENAQKKAVAFAQASGMIAMADDSGLEVDVLGGAPGIYSARYAPQPGATDANRRAYLLRNLQGKPRPWTAHFRATIAIAIPNQSVQITHGDCTGEIIPEERGTGGFGYDPIFFIPEVNRTMAELSLDEKNLLSHRARAVINAKPILSQIFGY